MRLCDPDPVTALATYAERTSAHAVSPDGNLRVVVDRHGRPTQVERGEGQSFEQSLWLVRLASEARLRMFDKRTRQLAEAARGASEHEIFGCPIAPGVGRAPAIVPFAPGVEIFPDAYRAWGFPDPVDPVSGQRPMLVDCQPCPPELWETLLRQLAWASSPDRRVQVVVDAYGAVAGIFVSADATERFTSGLLTTVSRRLHTVACGYMRGILRELTAPVWSRAPYVLRSYAASWTEWPEPESELWDVELVRAQRPAGWPDLDELDSVEPFSPALVTPVLLAPHRNAPAHAEDVWAADSPGPEASAGTPELDEQSAVGSAQEQVLGWHRLPNGAELAVDGAGLPRRVLPVELTLTTEHYEAGLEAARAACSAALSKQGHTGPVFEVSVDPTIIPLLWTQSWWEQSEAETKPELDERAHRFGLKVAVKRSCTQDKDTGWLDRMYTKASGVLAVETSQDGLMSVTVGAHCVPTQVVVDPSAWAAHSPERIVDQLNQCYLDAADQVRATQVWMLRELWRCPSDLVVDHYTPHISFLHPVPGAGAPVRLEREP